MKTEAQIKQLRDNLSQSIRTEGEHDGLKKFGLILALGVLTWILEDSSTEAPSIDLLSRLPLEIARRYQKAGGE